MQIYAGNCDGTCNKDHVHRQLDGLLLLLLITQGRFVRDT